MGGVLSLGSDGEPPPSVTTSKPEVRLVLTSGVWKQGGRVLPPQAPVWLDIQGSEPSRAPSYVVTSQFRHPQPESDFAGGETEAQNSHHRQNLWSFPCNHPSAFSSGPPWIGSRERPGLAPSPVSFLRANQAAWEKAGWSAPAQPSPRLTSRSPSGPRAVPDPEQERCEPGQGSGDGTGRRALSPLGGAAVSPMAWPEILPPF